MPPNWLRQKESDVTYRPATAEEIRETLEGIFPLSLIEALWGPRAEPAATSTCANPKCKSPAFVPNAPKQIYCCDSCRVAGLRHRRDQAGRNLMPIEQSPISDKWTGIKIVYCVHKTETWYRIDHESVSQVNVMVTGYKVVCNAQQLPMRIRAAIIPIINRIHEHFPKSLKSERIADVIRMLHAEIDAHFKAMGYDVESKTLGELYDAARKQPQLTPQ